MLWVAGGNPRLPALSDNPDPESIVWNPESKTALDPFIWGER